MTSTPGTYRGKHFSEWTSTARQLIREGDLVAAERLLLGMVKATEAESRANRWGVAPWPYEQLAITYRKRSDLAAELVILERYDRQVKAPGVLPAKLAARLEAVRSHS